MNLNRVENPKHWSNEHTPVDVLIRIKTLKEALEK